MEFLKEVLAAVGGGLGIVLFFLAFGKGIIEKLVDTTIEKTAEKSLAKYANTLERRTKAYEMLLEKEFSFFETASAFVSSLVVDIHDFSYYLGVDEEHPGEANLEKAKEIALRILKSIPTFKHESLLAGAYLTEEVHSASVKIISDLQKAVPLFYDALKISVDGVLDADTIKQIAHNKELTLLNCALLTTKIKVRLEKLSEE